MLFKKTSQPSIVSFFKHFPHYLLRHYDGQPQYSQQDFLEKGKANNCEWLTRPNIAISKTDQVICKNWEILRKADILEASVIDTLEKLLDPTHTHTNLHCTKKSCIATNYDVYQALRWCFKGELQSRNKLTLLIISSISCF